MSLWSSVWGWTRAKLGWGAYLLIPILGIAVGLWFLWRAARRRVTSLEGEVTSANDRADAAAESAQRTEAHRARDDVLVTQRDDKLEVLRAEREALEAESSARTAEILAESSDADAVVERAKKLRERGRIP